MPRAPPQSRQEWTEEQSSPNWQPIEALKNLQNLALSPFKSLMMADHSEAGTFGRDSPEPPLLPLPLGFFADCPEPVGCLLIVF